MLPPAPRNMQVRLKFAAGIETARKKKFSNMKLKKIKRFLGLGSVISAIFSI